MIFRIVGFILALSGIFLMRYLYRHYQKRSDFLADECYKWVRERYRNRTEEIYKGDRFRNILWVAELAALGMVAIGFYLLLA